MAKFSKDVDILKYEPVLFGELYLQNQVLTKGSGGNLSGTTFTKTGTDFVGTSVESGHVIYLRSSDGVLDGIYEIVSVDSATQLTVSVMRTDVSDEAIAPPTGSDVSYRVSTLDPQAAEVGFQLTEHLGIKPGKASSLVDTDDILDTTVLKQVSVFGIISNVYCMLAGQKQEDGFYAKSSHYRKLFEKAKERCRVAIDTDGDGLTEFMIDVGSSRLVRD